MSKKIQNYSKHWKAFLQNYMKSSTRKLIGIDTKTFFFGESGEIGAKASQVAYQTVFIGGLDGLGQYEVDLALQLVDALAQGRPGREQLQAGQLSHGLIGRDLKRHHALDRFLEKT